VNDLVSYEELATLLHTNRDMLYGLASKHADVFKPDRTVGTAYYFTPESVARIQAWWDEHSRFRAKPRSSDEPAYTVEELTEKFDLPFTTIQYYRRRYGMLYPDLYAPNPKGRGRPLALYLQSTIEEWQRWVEAGRPEPGYMRVKSVTLNQGRFDAIVWFGDGTTAGLLGEDWRISPPPDSAEMAEHYIRFATRWVENERYRQRWKRKETE
jgi:hypothetical protein